MSHDETCTVCGRTILAGERTRRYVSPAGHRDVCELCTPRAERLGWQRQRSGMPESLPAPEKRRLFGGLLRRRPKRAPVAEPSFEERAEGPGEGAEAGTEAAPGADPGAGDRSGVEGRHAPEDRHAPRDRSGEPAAEEGRFGVEAAFEGETGTEVAEGEARAEAAVGGKAGTEAPARGEGGGAGPAGGEVGDRGPDPAPRPSRDPDPAAPGARPQRLDPEPTLLSPFERAVARFNGSEASRTVAGLVRTLGAPWVSVGASAGAPREIRITVAWELSWYQWGVDLGDELRPVFQIDKGLEMDQLDAAARQWNASAAEGGRLVLVAPARRRRADGAPAAR